MIFGLGEKISKGGSKNTSEQQFMHAADAQLLVNDILNAISENRIPVEKRASNVDSKGFLGQYSFAVALGSFNRAKSAAVQMVAADGKINTGAVQDFHNMTDETIRALDQFIAGDIPADRDIASFAGKSREQYEAGAKPLELQKGQSAADVAFAIKKELLKAKDTANSAPQLREHSPGFNDWFYSEMEIGKHVPDSVREFMDTLRKSKPRNANELRQRKKELIENIAHNIVVTSSDVVQAAKDKPTPDEAERQAKKQTAANIASHITNSASSSLVTLNTLGLGGYYSGAIEKSKGLRTALTEIRNSGSSLFDAEGNPIPEQAELFNKRIDSAIAITKTLPVRGVMPALGDDTKGSRALLIEEQLLLLKDVVFESLPVQQAQEPKRAPSPPEKKQAGKDKKISMLVNPAEFGNYVVASVEDDSPLSPGSTAKGQKPQAPKKAASGGSAPLV